MSNLAVDGEILDEGELLPAAIIGDRDTDTQIATAKRFPRSLTDFKRRALQYATFSEEVAKECFYCVPRAGKSIEGPSARFAEIILSAWGNSRGEADTGEPTATDIPGIGMCWDLESNVAVRVKVKRRITNKNNIRYGDDMIVTTGNAASSIAFRNAVLKVVPKALWKPIYEQARLAAIGKTKSIVQHRSEWKETFAKIGVTVDQLNELLGKKSMDDWIIDDMITLLGTWNSIKDGQANIDEVFPKTPQKDAVKKMTEKKTDQQSPPDQSQDQPTMTAEHAAMLDECADMLKEYTEKEVAEMFRTYKIGKLDTATLDQTKKLHGFLAKNVKE
jgi:hypothetical protein